MPLPITKITFKKFLHGLLPKTIAHGEQLIPMLWRAQCWSWLGCYEKALKIYNESGANSKRVNLRLLAACGMTNELKRRTKSLKNVIQREKAALAIMAFAPDLACELFSETGPCVSYAATLSTLGKYAEAREVLKASEYHDNSNGEVSLLEANCGLLDPLDAINRCLSNNNLAIIYKEEAAKGALSFNGKCLKNQREGPRVTIIVAAYNTREYIGKSILSLLKQTWENIEIIVVDDASTDDTLEVLKGIAKQDQRLKIVRELENQGPYAARMKAIGMATGEFLTCHDSDDWAHPEKIARQVKPMLQDSRLVATTSCWVRMTAEDKFYVRKSWPLIHHNPASPMFRKDAILNIIGGFDMVRAGADSEFYERLKLSFGANKIRQVDGILTIGSHRTSSITNCKETGVIDFKPSHSRIAYWEAWRHWHIECIRKGISPKMPSCGGRPFNAPDEIVIKPSQPFQADNSQTISKIVTAKKDVVPQQEEQEQGGGAGQGS